MHVAVRRLGSSYLPGRRFLGLLDAAGRGAHSFGSRALSIRSLIQGGPPSFSNFARCSAVSRTATGIVSLLGSMAGRPGRFFAGGVLDFME